MAKQTETALIVGTITVSGNALITVTASGMNNSPKALSVPVLSGDNDAAVAQKVRYALATDPDVAGFGLISGSGANYILTARLDAANDPTMNIASANGTCSGLTAQPTSTNTTPGSVVITHGYITLDEFHAMKRIDTTKTSDDTAIAFLIESASRYIDHNASRRFYISDSDEIHYFNTPGWENWIEGGGSFYSGYGLPTQWNEPKLMFDDDLYSITSITNGDGTVLIQNTDYVLKPFNRNPPYYCALLMSTNVWKAQNNTNPIRCIQVLGKWGFCDIADVPGDLKEACYLIAMAAYNRRLGENVSQKVVITAAGAVISPDDVPAKARDTIYCHQRISFG